jgi:gamma-glutamyltranspeptidase/glutathione hydrolase
VFSMNISGIFHYISPFNDSSNARKLWQFTAAHCRDLTVVIALSATTSLMACGGMPSVRLELGDRVSQSTKHASFVVAGEPQAALIAREVLLSGGNAVDAAAALGFSLAVTLPSSAGLGGGGVCMHYNSARDEAEVLDFLNFRASPARPRLARGLFSLHAKYGILHWSRVVAPAENLARFGFPVSRALVRDLEDYGSRLMTDRATIEAFMTPQKELLRAGESLQLPRLASALGVVRSGFFSDLNVDLFEAEVAAALAKVLSIKENEIPRSSAPEWDSVSARPVKNMRLFLYSSEEVLESSKGRESDSLDLSDEPSVGATEFIVADAQGRIVICALTMGRPFGLGVMPRNLGFLLASETLGDFVPDSPISIAYLADRNANNVALAAISSGPDARHRVMSVVRDIDQSGSRYANWKKTQVREHPSVSMAYCERASPNARSQCRVSAGVDGHGYAAMINLER